MKDHSKFIGIALLCAALGLMAWQAKDQSARQQAYREANPQAYPTPTQVSTVQANSEQAASKLEAAPLSVAKAPLLDQQCFTTLENDFVKMTFTSRGGALHSVAFKAYPEKIGAQEPYRWISTDLSPALAMTTQQGTLDLSDYQLVAQTSDSLTYQRDLENGLTLRRQYTLTSPQKRRTADGYLLELQNTWVNSTADDLTLPSYGLFIASAQPTSSDPHNTHLNFGTYNGKDGKYVTPSVFKGSNFVLWKSDPKSEYQVSGTTIWATVKNQFFTTITTPSVAAIGAWARPVSVESDDASVPTDSLQGGLLLPAITIPAKGSTSVNFSNYIGPMEYNRIASIDARQDDVMQWGWPIFSFFAKLFISVLNTIARAVHNYGVAILILTALIRVALWPFTAAAGKASKKMAAVQPMIKQIQEKYKDDPQKQQKETLKIFTQYKINPMAGCLPSLLQIPVFLGFFYMLRSAAELRFEQFLWIKDLSMPDTIATIAGFPINPLPIIMILSMYFQIKLTPTSGDPDQQKIMQFTPFIFGFVLYSFSSGLTLYWTVSNILSILQQIHINRQKDDTLPPLENDGKVIDISSAKV